MNFACVHIPNLTVQVAVRLEPALRSRAVAIVDEAPSRFVVAANQPALEAGIKLGMTHVQAAQFETVEIRPRSPAQEAAAHAALLDLGFSYSPRVEDEAIDTLILDLQGLGSLLGSQEQIADTLAESASQLGFEGRVALAPNPQTAVYAARCRRGITLISPGEELERLGDLSLEVLGLQTDMLETLDRWGIRTFRALAALPTAQLSERLGEEGVRAQAQARGISSGPLVPAQPKLDFEEVMELEDPIEQLESLAFALSVLLNRLCARLRVRGLAAEELLLAMDLDARPDAEQIETESATKYERKLRLPVPSQNSMTLLKLLQLNLEAHPPAAPVARIKLKAEAARPRALQGGLFRMAAPDPEKLETTLARIAKITENVGSPELLDTHRPGAFRMTRFNPFERTAGAKTAHDPAPGRKEVSMALRFFRPPLPAKVETRDRRPACVFFDGTRGAVAAAAGPWRTSGDWWAADGWQHDEWDVELKIRTAAHHCDSLIGGARPPARRALYRIYQDLASGKWFVEGNYD